ncbi:hypothetical protein WN943_015937 [Citrus x changshan-huyou]
MSVGLSCLLVLMAILWLHSNGKYNIYPSCSINLVISHVTLVMKPNNIQLVNIHKQTLNQHITSAKVLHAMAMEGIFLHV